MIAAGIITCLESLEIDELALKMAINHYTIIIEVHVCLSVYTTLDELEWFKRNLLSSIYLLYIESIADHSIVTTKKKKHMEKTKTAHLDLLYQSNTKKSKTHRDENN